MERLYTIGKGKLLFKPEGEANYRDMGNCPDFKITISTEKKEHFSSRSGIQVKDKEVVIKQTASGSFTLDELVDYNLRAFIMSAASTVQDQTSGTATGQVVTSAHDRWIYLGKKMISNLVVKDAAETKTYVLGVDYIADLKAGLIMCLSTGEIVDGQSLKISYAYAAITTKKMGAATTTTIQGHVWFVGDPPVGKVIDIKGYAALSPNGDLSLIGEDWTTFGFNMDFILHNDYAGLFELIDRGTVV